MAEMVRQKSYARKPFARERRLQIAVTVVVQSVEGAGDLVPGAQTIEVGRESHKRLSTSAEFESSEGLKFCPKEECTLMFKSLVMMRPTEREDPLIIIVSTPRNQLLTCVSSGSATAPLLVAARAQAAKSTSAVTSTRPGCDRMETCA
jgi:hypothetical protein